MHKKIYNKLYRYQQIIDKSTGFISLKDNKNIYINYTLEKRIEKFLKKKFFMPKLNRILLGIERYMIQIPISFTEI